MTSISTSTSSSPLEGVISPLAISSAPVLSESYPRSLPFPHGVVTSICHPEFLIDVLEELKHNSRVKFKESDLFRVYQSVDLMNLRPGTDDSIRMPMLSRLRGALYSAEFRSYVERIANLDVGTLTERVDCAANCHAKGCHLLCHVDAIGTRAVSFILYLTDPEPVWGEEDGGHLELYDSVTIDDDGDVAAEVGADENGSERGGKGEGRRRRDPLPFPCKTILPSSIPWPTSPWNRDGPSIQ